jgi:arylsulfatase
MKGDAAHLGAVRNPLVIRWPGRVPEPGARRFGFAHVVDIFPTVLEAAGMPVPLSWDGVEQMPVDGVSLIPSLAEPKALQRPRTQYFETVGNRALYQDGWLASASYAMGWPQRPDQPLDQVPWSLFNVAKDFSQSADLARRDPKKLAELRDLFDRAAQDNDVYPLLEPSEAEPVDRPRAASGDFVSFYPETPRLQMALAPDLTVSHRIDIQLRRQGHDEADLLSWGGRHGGLQLLIRDDSLVCVVRGPGVDDRVFQAPGALPQGELRLGSRFQRDEGGRGGVLRLLVNDRVELETRIDGLFAYPFGRFEVATAPGSGQGTRVMRVDVTYL